MGLMNNIWKKLMIWLSFRSVCCYAKIKMNNNIKDCCSKCGKVLPPNQQTFMR